MKTEKIVLTVLCAAACLWSAKMMVGVIGLSQHQDVPALAAAFELLMFLGAGLLPLMTIWFVEPRKRKWLYAIWTPCVLYVVFVAVNYSRVSLSAGVIRLFFWSAIAFLFIREPKKKNRPNRVVGGN